MADYGPRSAPIQRAPTVDQVLASLPDQPRYVCRRCGEVPRAEVAVTAASIAHTGPRADGRRGFDGRPYICNGTVDVEPAMAGA